MRVTMACHIAAVGRYDVIDKAADSRVRSAPVTATSVSSGSEAIMRPRRLPGRPSSSLLMTAIVQRPGGSVTRAVYNGHEALTFPDYLDPAETGKTLYAEPGGVCDIAPASGPVWCTGVPRAVVQGSPTTRHGPRTEAAAEAERLAAESAAGEGDATPP